MESKENGDYFLGSAAAVSNSSDEEVVKNVLGRSETMPSINICSGEEQLQSRKEVPGLCGLKNIGNSCYMNSVLQCMSNCPPLKNYFVSGEFRKHLENPGGRGGEYGKLMETMWSGNHKSTAPTKFKAQVAKYAPQFMGLHQHDCQEFLTFLLDGLHEDLNNISVKPCLERSDSERCPDEQLAYEVWRKHIEQNSSIISRYFHGMSKSSVICSICDEKSVTFDQLCYLSLPLPVTNERRIEVTLYHHDPWKIPTEYHFMVPKNGKISDMLLGLKNLCRSPLELLVTQVARGRFRTIFSTEDPLSNIGDEDNILVYEVPPQDSGVKIAVCLWECKKPKFHVNHLFGTPFVITVPEDSCSADSLYNILMMKFARHLTNSDQKAAIWLLELTGQYDDPEIRASTLKSMMSSLPHPLFSFHVIEGSRVSDFPDDAGQASLLCRLGSRYLAVQWKPEDRAKYFGEGILEEREQHESVRQLETQKVTLLECFKLYTMCEQLDADNAWYCPSCKKHQQASKRIELWRLPTVLVIQLNRFMYSGNGHKIDTFIDFPMEDLDLSDFCRHKSGKFRLIGVCNHFGSLDSGHYTSYSLHEPTNRWYEFDDNVIIPMTSRSVVGRLFNQDQRWLLSQIQRRFEIRRFGRKIDEAIQSIQRFDIRRFGRRPNNNNEIKDLAFADFVVICSNSEAENNRT